MAQVHKVTHVGDVTQKRLEDIGHHAMLLNIQLSCQHVRTVSDLKRLIAELGTFNEYKRDAIVNAFFSQKVRARTT